MKTLDMMISAGLGDSLVIRIFFDPIKNIYDQIRISHNPQIINYFRNNDQSYQDFLNQWGNLLFSSSPYIFDTNNHPPLGAKHLNDLVNELNIIPQKPQIDHLLCKGSSLNIEKYIVVTTKIRGIPKNIFYSKSIFFWKSLKQLSQKYKIVILGEREVEKSKEYNLHTNSIYGIYDQIITNIPMERIIDLTVPALGITVPSIEKIQQDCLIMKQAEFVITFGLGGNFLLAISVANTIGFRVQEDYFTNNTADRLNNSLYPSIFITKDWNQFINKLGEYK